MIIIHHHNLCWWWLSIGLFGRWSSSRLSRILRPEMLWSWQWWYLITVKTWSLQMFTITLISHLIFAACLEHPALPPRQHWDNLPHLLVRAFVITTIIATIIVCSSLQSSLSSFLFLCHVHWCGWKENWAKTNEIWKILTRKNLHSRKSFRCCTGCPWCWDKAKHMLVFIKNLISTKSNPV